MDPLATRRAAFRTLPARYVKNHEGAGLPAFILVPRAVGVTRMALSSSIGNEMRHCADGTVPLSMICSMARSSLLSASGPGARKLDEAVKAAKLTAR